MLPPESNRATAAPDESNSVLGLPGHESNRVASSQNFLLCSGGDLNPILGFCFPLFFRVFPWGIPSGEKTMESSGSKSLVNPRTCFMCVLIIFYLPLAGL